MPYEIITRENAAIKEYSRFVRSHANCHFLQDPAWARVKKMWQWQAVVVRNQQGNVVAAMSILLRRLPLGYHIAYAPRGPVCNRQDAAVIQAIAQGVQQLAREKKCLLTYMDPDESEDNALFRTIMSELGYVERHSDHFGGVQAQTVFRLGLKGKDEEQVMTGFSQKTRYNIRLAQRKGVTIARFPGGRNIPPEALDRFALLMKTTGQRDHFCIRNREYFENILSALGNDAVLYLAYLDGEAIGGTIAVFYGDKAWYLYGASSNEKRSAMPNYLLQWTMIQESLRRKCALYDFRGVPATGKTDDPLYGLYRFKKGFGGVYTRFTGLFTYYHKPLLGRLFDKAQRSFRKLRRKKKV